MLLVQTHFPQKGINWQKVAMISIGLLVSGFLIYQAFKPVKLKIISTPEEVLEDKTE
jgi:hypothetical protein